MTATTPRTVRRIGSPAAVALADLAAIFEDLQTTLLCCERLVAELSRGEADPVTAEALWTTALLSYSRCFAAGERGMGLTEDDVSGLELQGEVLPWHRMLRQLTTHVADQTTNPRETFEVGVAVEDGRPAGVAITSNRHTMIDDQTVRQTGAVAYALHQLVDRRIAAHQETVLRGAEALSASELADLDEIEVTADGVPAPVGEDGEPTDGGRSRGNGS